MTDEYTFAEIDIVRVFDAPRETVWQAFTDADQIARWWGPAGMHTPRESVELDLQPGGAFRVTMVDEAGTEYPTDMRISKVDAPSVLEFEWDGQRGIGGGRTTLTFADLGDGRTELTNHFAGHTNDTLSGFMVEGTNQQYDKLAALLA